jgi:protein-tyrosine phosphatase
MVCTGNICRSPQAEQLARTLFMTAWSERSEWSIPRVSSAGTNALDGSLMPEQAAILSREYGADPTLHQAKRLTAGMVEESDLVLAMSREHRSAVVRLRPRASQITFTLREFANIIDHMAREGAPDQKPSHGDFSAWLEGAKARRGHFPLGPSAHDVVDPYQQSNETYRESMQQIYPALATIISTIVSKSS